MGRSREKSVHAVLAAFARGTLGHRYQPEIPARVAERISKLVPTQRDQLTRVLASLDTRAGALALTGRPIPVSWLSDSAAEALIQRWSQSRLQVHRSLARTVSALSASAAYAYPGPLWESIGYPGPLGKIPDEPKRLSVITPANDEHLKCDVVIVGSGAGGGCVAAHLSQAGFDVVVVEKGGYYTESDFHHNEERAALEMYSYGLLLSTTDLSCYIVAGSVLGGGTLVNYATSFRTPDHVCRQWAEMSGVEAFVSGEYQDSLDEVSARLGVNNDSSAAGPRDALMEEGLKKLGWHVDMMPRAVRGCTQDEQCGYCGFGCRVGAKQSTMRTYLEDAAAAGARLLVDTDVRKISIRDGRAHGIEGVSGANRVTVDARAVVCAAGSIETPALLLRSGLGGQVGHNLRLHPGTAAWGIFDDDVHIWEGTTQARYSQEFSDWDGGYGPILETIPIHPGAWASALAWTSARHHASFMDKYANTSFCGALSRDTSAGRVRIDRKGHPRIDYRLNAADQRRVGQAVIASAKVLEAAGAREIFAPHPVFLSYSPGSPGAHERWAEETMRLGYRKQSMYSWHQMGSCRMGVDPTRSAIGPENETHEVQDLFVTDGSTFPDASGVNPMLSIYAIANRAGKKIAEKLS